jgi:DNA-binding CsgD family transcriptional regulator/tetratricopeptide (TPR) repeat protein
MRSWVNNDQNDVLVGRSTALEQIIQILHTTMSGNIRMVFVKGEAGIGKTRLVSEIASEMQLKQWLVIKGDGSSFEETLAFSPLIQAFRMAIDTLSEQEKQLVANKFQYLNIFFPNLGGEMPVPLPQPEIERTRLFESLRLFTVYLASKRPLLFWIEDLPEVDSDTLDWIQYFAKHTEKAPIAIIATYKTSAQNEIPNTLNRLESYLTQDRIMHTVSLEPLTVDESMQLISAKLKGKIDKDALRKISDHTLRIPLYIVEFIRTLHMSGILFQEEGIWNLKKGAEEHVPQSIKALLEQRLAKISEQELKILSYLLVSKDFVPWSVLQHASNLGTEKLHSQLLSLLKKGFLTEGENDNEISYTLPHSILKIAFKNMVHQVTLKEAHKIMAEAWYEKDILRSAYHLLSTGIINDYFSSAKLLFEAGKKYLSLGSYNTAVDYLRKADELLNEYRTINTASELHWKIHLSLSEALTNVGKHDEALILLTGLYYKDIETSKKIVVKRWMTWVEVNRSYDEALRHIKEGLQLWDGNSENPDVLWLLNEQIFNYLNAGSYAEAQNSLEVLESYVEKYNSPRAELLYVIRKAHVALLSWKDPGFNPKKVNHIIEQAYKLGEPELIYDVSCLLGYISLNQGDYKTALRFANECIALVRRNGMVIHEVSVRLLKMCGLFMKGNWSAALKEAEENEKLANEFEIDAAILCILDFKGLIYVAQGKTNEGYKLLHESEKLVHDVFSNEGPHKCTDAIHLVRAVEYLISGTAKENVKTAKKVYWANTHGLRSFIKLIEGILLLRAGLINDTKELLQQMRNAAPINEPNYVIGIIALLKGLLEEINGKNLEAENHLRYAVDIFKSLHLPLELGLARAYLAEVVNGDGKKTALEQSIKGLNKINAYAVAKWVERKLPKIDVKNQADSPPLLIEELTKRELEILNKLASGLSNKEIAGQLNLTVGTVKIHLNNLYGKLGVNRRVQAVNRARELNIIL